MILRKKIVCAFVLFVCLIFSRIQAQTVPYAFPYQGVARDVSGVIISNQSIKIKAGIYSGSASGALEWEETQIISTDFSGLFQIKVGQGTTTGSGSISSFSAINWGASGHYLKIQIDYTGGSSYINMGTSQLISVPYAFYSGNSGSLTGTSINDLTDVDTSGNQVGYLLKWDGFQWVPSPDKDRDTVSFASNAEHVFRTGTSTYAMHIMNMSDTVSFAYQVGPAGVSSMSQNTGNSQNSINSDTAFYATSFLPYNWSAAGNTSSALANKAGTIDSSDFVLKANNLERLRFTALGNIGVGNSSPISQLHITGIDGLVHLGIFGAGDTMLSYVSGTNLMWYARRGSFRAGTISGTQWSNSLTGDCSFGAGYNPMVSGQYSAAFGNSSSVYCLASMAMGYKCSTAILSGIDDGGSLAMGDSCIVTYTRSVAMGDHCTSNGGYSFGSHNVTNGGTGFAFGLYNQTFNGSGISLGSYASTNLKSGCFVYGDSSSTSLVKALANNQFVVRTSGGTIFYSDSSATNGVTLFAGSGSWASVSDRNKKENFYSLDGEEILQKISKIKITSWNYKSQSRSIRHIGPMAQDFYKSFKLGESRRKINMVDIDGITMLAVKTLYVRVNTLDASFEEENQIKAEMQNISNDQESMEKRLDRIQKLLILQQ